MVFMQHLRRPPPAGCRSGGDLGQPGQSGHASRAFGALLLSLHRDGPAIPIRRNWDHIPGAHGSTPQALAYSKTYGDFRRLGVKLFGLSLLDTEWQRDFVTRNALTFRLLSDWSGRFSGRLGLPLFETGGRGLSAAPDRRGLHDGIIRVLRYPVPEPEQDAIVVLDMLPGTG